MAANIVMIGVSAAVDRNSKNDKDLTEDPRVSVNLTSKMEVATHDDRNDFQQT